MNYRFIIDVVIVKIDNFVDGFLFLKRHEGKSWKHTNHIGVCHLSLDFANKAIQIIQKRIWNSFFRLVSSLLLESGSSHSNNCIGCEATNNRLQMKTHSL